MKPTENLLDDEQKQAIKDSLKRMLDLPDKNTLLIIDFDALLANISHIAGYIVGFTQGFVHGRMEKMRANVGPPKVAECLFYFLLDKKTRENLAGDLEEEYYDFTERFGRRIANLWYWKQVAISTWPLIHAGVSKIYKWGIVVGAEEYVRRIIETKITPH